MEDQKEEKQFFFWFLVVIGLFTIGISLIDRASRELETGILRYEEYQEIYQSCQKLNTDLCNLTPLPEKDKMFEQFSKAQRINTMRTNLNRWVQEYNAKSKMVNHSLWKSQSLPYQLSITDFSCY